MVFLFRPRTKPPTIAEVDEQSLPVERNGGENRSELYRDLEGLKEMGLRQTERPGRQHKMACRGDGKKLRDTFYNSHDECLKKVHKYIILLEFVSTVNYCGGPSLANPVKIMYSIK